MLRKKVSTIGKSKGLILDRPILELYRIGDEVDIKPTSDGLGFEVRPASGPDEHNDKLKAALERGNKRYGRMLKNLA